MHCVPPRGAALRTRVALTNSGGYEDRGNGLQYSALSPFGFDGRYLYVVCCARRF
jgi:hypothetical protein